MFGRAVASLAHAPEVVAHHADDMAGGGVGGDFNGVGVCPIGFSAVGDGAAGGGVGVGTDGGVVEGDDERFARRAVDSVVVANAARRSGMQPDDLDIPRAADADAGARAVHVAGRRAEAGWGRGAGERAAVIVVEGQGAVVRPDDGADGAAFVCGDIGAKYDAVLDGAVVHGRDGAGGVGAGEDGVADDAVLDGAVVDGRDGADGVGAGKDAVADADVGEDALVVGDETRAGAAAAADAGDRVSGTVDGAREGMVGVAEGNEVAVGHAVAVGVDGERVGVVGDVGGKDEGMVAVAVEIAALDDKVEHGGGSDGVGPVDLLDRAQAVGANDLRADVRADSHDGRRFLVNVAEPVVLRPVPGTRSPGHAG